MGSTRTTTPEAQAEIPLKVTPWGELSTEYIMDPGVAGSGLRSRSAARSHSNLLRSSGLVWRPTMAVQLHQKIGGG